MTSAPPGADGEPGYACALCHATSGSTGGFLRAEPGPGGAIARATDEFDVQWVCGSCIREYVPSIESRLSRAWWESAAIRAAT